VWPLDEVHRLVLAVRVRQRFQPVIVLVREAAVGFPEAAVEHGLKVFAAAEHLLDRVDLAWGCALVAGGSALGRGDHELDVAVYWAS
jgi:hypothetical protein